MRILYPWIKKKKGLAFKTMLAILYEKEYKKFKDIKRSKFLKLIFKMAIKKFPTMFSSVRKYHLKRKSDITFKKFERIVYCRINNMFSGSEKTTEHPFMNKKYNKYIRICNILIEQNKTYEEFMEENLE